MAKVRVYELARDLGRESKDVLERAQELGLEVKTASSGLDEDSVALVRMSYDGATATDSAEEPTPVAETPAPTVDEAAPVADESASATDAEETSPAAETAAPEAEGEPADADDGDERVLLG